MDREIEAIVQELREGTSGSYDYRERRYQTFLIGKMINVGGLVIEPIHVDHSIPAAYGFIIHTLRTGFRITTSF
jgi:mRNA degradation ribonuclease J1/J2